MTPENPVEEPAGAVPFIERADHVINVVLSSFGDPDQAKNMVETVRVAMSMTPGTTLLALLDEVLTYVCIGNAMHVASDLQRKQTGPAAEQWGEWFHQAGQAMLALAIERFDRMQAAADAPADRKVH